MWKFYRNSVARAIHQEKSSFASRKLAQAESKSTSWYSTAKVLSGLKAQNSTIHLPGTAHLSTTDLANTINAHFTAIASSLPALDRGSLPTYLPAARPAPTVSRSQMWRELSRIKVNTAAGPDNIPNKILKEFAFELSTPASDILNSSLKSGVVPKQWKRAVVIPLPKTIPTPSMDKLRPISLTSTLCKVCETFVTRWMLEDMDCLLDSKQYGNRKGLSTSHYLVDMVQYILNEAERGHSVNLLAIDYSKAFDKVDITVAMHKLLHMHVRCELLPWVADFLTDREQCVRLSGQTSTWSETTCGVPQGTKLGPTVFLAMVNDVASENQTRWKYVDDITVAEAYNPRISAGTGTQQAMDRIFTRATQDNMTLNVEKCAVMQCTLGGRPRPVNVTANNSSVPVVTSLKLLGVTVLPSLKWDEHIEDIVSKSNSKRYFLAVLRRAGVTSEHLIKFYTTFIRPTLEYAAPVWHSSLPLKLSDSLEAVQRTSLRVIFPDMSYSQALETTGLPMLSTRREQLCAKFARSTYKAEKQQHWFPPKREECHNYNLRNNEKLSGHKSRTSRLYNSPVHYFCRLLNKEF